jgi:hypothetical protein
MITIDATGNNGHDVNFRGMGAVDETLQGELP